MNPFVYLIGVIIALILSGYALSAVLTIKIYPVLFAWLWFNFWIAIYEIYIVYNRRQLIPGLCDEDFWKRDTTNARFWKEAWNEYACVADARYLTPHDFVFVIEAINALLIALLIVAVYLQANNIVIGPLLLLQAYHCAIYFASWAHSGGASAGANGAKSAIYLGISAAWIIVPVYIIAKNM